MTATFISGASAVAGLATHLIFFNRAEHHLHGKIYVQLLVVSCFAAVLFDFRMRDVSTRENPASAVSLFGLYLGGIYVSLLAYRIFFHPLNKFPGPFGARISSLWFATQLKKGDAHKKVLNLHQRYGDFLRIGSSDLSITNPQAINVIYGPGSRCTKAAWYDLTYPMVSLQTARQRSLHDQRRRIWSNAFNDRALRGYEKRMKVYRDMLVQKITAFGEQPVDVTKWFNWYAFDVMGDLAFGTSFHMLETNEEHWAIRLLNQGLEPLAWHFPTWLFRLFVSVPGLGRSWWGFIHYCCHKLDERIKKDVEVPDILSTLLQNCKSSKSEASELRMLQGDAQLIVVAGSDTTSATLTNIYYELMRNPEHIAKLRAEILPHTVHGEVRYQDIQKLGHLNGVINETLRLHPPVPTALPRLTPVEGIQVGGISVPGNVTVWCPQYVIGRSETVYLDPLAFIPERWYSRPELILDKSAFAPFSTGPYGCIGKALALQNLRNTVAQLIMSFDVGFARGEDGSQLEEKTKDHFTVALSSLKLTFRSRKVV